MDGPLIRRLADLLSFFVYISCSHGFECVDELIVGQLLLSYDTALQALATHIKKNDAAAVRRATLMLASKQT